MYRVLLLDDEPMALKVCKHTLAWDQFGMDVILEETNASTALQKLLDTKIDIAFVDLNMPGMDGFAFMEALRQIQPHVLCVILTGYQEYEYVRKAFKTKVFDYCLKPIRSRENQTLLPDLELAAYEIRLQVDAPFADLKANQFNEKIDGRLSNHSAYRLVNVKMNHSLLSSDNDEKPSALSRIQLISSIGGIHIQLNPNTFSFFIGTDEIEQQAPDEQYRLLQHRIHEQLVVSEHAIQRELLGTVWPSWLNACEQNQEAFSMISNEQLMNEQNEIIDQILVYIHDHYTETLSLRDVSDYFNLNYVYCSEYFSRHMGISFSAYVNKLRLKRACDLLSQTNASILSIALDVGYNSEHYFSRVFKEQMSQTPTQYRHNQEVAK